MANIICKTNATGDDDIYKFTQAFKQNLTEVIDNKNKIINLKNYAFYNNRVGAISKVYLPSCLTIGSSAFALCNNLSEVYAPLCESIGDGAFQNCSLIKEFNFPLCTSVGDGAFTGCSQIEKMILPKYAGSIGANAYANNVNLKELQFGDILEIGSSAFRGCVNLQKAEFPIVSTINNYAYSGCSSLTTISFPACTNIKDYAFQNCTNLKNIYFSSMVNIGSYAFVNTNLSKLNSSAFAGGLTIQGTSAFVNTNINVIDHDNINFTPEGINAFKGNTLLESVNMPNVTYIPAGTFDNCTFSQENLNIPNCININGFGYHTGITNIDRSSPFSNVNIIGSLAFLSCPNLSNIDIDAIEIGSSAFQSCSSLQSISLPKCTSIYNNAFLNCSSLSTINNLEKVKYIGSNAFGWCTKLSGVLNIPECTTLSGSFYLSGSVTGYHYFSGCFYGTKLEEINCPNVTTITGPVFQSCFSLKSISLSNISTINQRQFMNCSALTSVSLSSGLLNVYPEAFKGCYSLSDFDFDRIRYLGNYAFQNCSLLYEKFGSYSGEYTFSNLEYIVPSLYETGNYADTNGHNYRVSGKGGLDMFSNISIARFPKLVSCMASWQSYGYNQNTGNYISNVYYSAGVAFPSNFKRIYLDKMTTLGRYFSSGVEYVEAPLATYLSNCAFSGCTDLKSISVSYVYYNSKIASRVASGVFSGCTNLESIYTTGYTDNNIFNTISWVNEYAFNGCKKLSYIENMPKLSSAGSYAFANTGITSFNSPLLSYIGSGAFMNCSDLVSIDQLNVRSIPNEAFYGCSKLESISLPSCSEIGSSAFYGCSSLSSVDIPNCITLYSNAFQGCVNLTSMKTSNFTSLYDNALPPNLSNITLNSNISFTTNQIPFGYTKYNNYYQYYNLNNVRYLGSIESDCYYFLNAINSIYNANLGAVEAGVISDPGFKFILDEDSYNNTRKYRDESSWNKDFRSCIYRIHTTSTNDPTLGNVEMTEDNKLVCTPTEGHILEGVYVDLSPDNANLSDMGTYKGALSMTSGTFTTLDVYYGKSYEELQEILGLDDVALDQAKHTYVSTNHDNNSFSYARFEFTTTKPCNITAMFANESEKDYDYLIIGKLDTEIPKNADFEDGDTIAINTSGYLLTTNYIESEGVESGEYDDALVISNVSPGSHFIEVKFTKDVSDSNYSDIGMCALFMYEIEEVEEDEELQLGELLTTEFEYDFGPIDEDFDTNKYIAVFK